MVSVLASRSSSLCLSSGQGHYTYMYCVVFLGKAVYSHSAGLSPPVYLNLMLVGNPVMA